MRENMGLYRGRILKSNQWVIGNLLVWKNGNCSILVNDLESNTKLPLEVDPKTVGQFTGLYDKNGKKIFEGDLVIPTNRQRLSNKPQVVSYNPISGYWQCSPMRSPKVVGNIYDNPELLKEGD